MCGKAEAVAVTTGEVRHPTTVAPRKQDAASEGVRIGSEKRNAERPLDLETWPRVTRRENLACDERTACGVVVRVPRSHALREAREARFVRRRATRDDADNHR